MINRTNRRRGFRFWAIVIGGDIVLGGLMLFSDHILAPPVAAIMGLPPGSEQSRVYALIGGVSLMAAIALIAAVWWFVNALRSEPTLRS